MTSHFPQIVLTCSPDGHITAYTTSSATAIARFSGSRSPRNGLTVLGNKNIAASHVSSETSTGSIHLYNWWSSTAFHHLSVPEPVAPLASTRDGRYLFSGGLSGHIHAFSLPSGDLVRSFPAHSKPISCFEINVDGSILLSGSDDGTVAIFPICKLLDASSRRSSVSDAVLHRLIGHESSVTAITTGIGGFNSTVISCSLDCTCKFWSLMHGTHLNTVTFPCVVWGIAMDTMESEFYAAGSDGSVYSGGLYVAGQLWEHGHKPEVWQQKHGGPIVAIATINYGQNLITASEDGNVWIWELETREVVKVLAKAETGSVSGLVVAKGFSEVGGNGKFSGYNFGFSVEAVSRPMREVMEMEEMLNGAVEDRSRAINNLESTMGIYEKLLELILKEVMAGNNSDGHGGDEE